MSRGMPSMTALLGLLALAGYQNRDKLAELLKGAPGNNAQPGAGNKGREAAAAAVEMATLLRAIDGGPAA